MIAPCLRESLAKLTTWLRTCVELTGLTEREVLLHLLESAKRREDVATYLRLRPSLVKAWAHDQFANLEVTGAVAYVFEETTQ